MTYTMQQYEESAQAIRARLNGFVPKVAMVLGSGLGFLGDQVENPIAIDYHDIPHFKTSTAPGHKGRLEFGSNNMWNVQVGPWQDSNGAQQMLDLFRALYPHAFVVGGS